MKEKSVQVSQ